MSANLAVDLSQDGGERVRDRAAADEVWAAARAQRRAGAAIVPLGARLVRRFLVARPNVVSVKLVVLLAQLILFGLNLVLRRLLEALWLDLAFAAVTSPEYLPASRET